MREQRGRNLGQKKGDVVLVVVRIYEKSKSLLAEIREERRAELVKRGDFAKRRGRGGKEEEKRSEKEKERKRIRRWKGQEKRGRNKI